MVAITRGDKTVNVDIPGMIAKGVNPDNIELRRGDMVRVFAQTDTKVYVFGEVQRPGSLTFNNGRMSLNEALVSTAACNSNLGRCVAGLCRARARRSVAGGLSPECRVSGCDGNCGWL